MALADLQILVDSLVRDQSGTLTPGDRDRVLELARHRYSTDAERELVRDVVWAEDGYYGPLPEGWTSDSWLVEAEHPIGEQPPSHIELSIYIDPTGSKLVALNAMSAGSVVRVRFGAPHQLTSTIDTIPAQHREAVASYAAHLLCMQLATHYSAERETSIGADGSNTESRAKSYSIRSKEYRAAYFAGIGKVDPQVAARQAGGQGGGGTPAASVGAWPGRRRAGLHTNDTGGY